MKNIENLQYITPSNPVEKIPGLVEKVCQGGCRWIQLRMKHHAVEDVEEVAGIVKEIWHRYQAVFIINDHVKVAEKIDADGVHLGKKDMKSSEARKILGEKKIIGCSANTIEDIEKVISTGIDYVGVGPFRFTETKEGLDPVLGNEGYLKIMKWYKEKKYKLPLIAIGGIKKNDIAGLLCTGINGIAVSSVVSNAKEVPECMKDLLNEIKRSKK